MTKITPRVPRGMRDILPEQMIRREFVVGVIRSVFEEFGFEPLQTPAIELSKTLMGKYGPDAERLIYSATHLGGKEKLALRYDLSVPLCRLVAMYPDLLQPFKRYQIAPVWRAERPQKGRYREFYQCDADTVGSASMLADAETINIIYEVLTRLGFTDFVTNVNNRKILNGIGHLSGVPAAKLGELYRSIDKLDKIGLAGVRAELRNSDIEETVIARLLSLLQIEGDNRSVLVSLRERLSEYPEAVEGINELQEIIEYLDLVGVSERYYRIKFAMVRGLEYYTGPIYETQVAGMPGSITGGGRFDNLVGMFLEHSYPATGTTIGIERIIDVMEERGMYPASVGRTTAQVLVTLFDDSLRQESLRTANHLRQSGIKTALYFDKDGLGKQLKYAARKGFKYVVIVGPDEAAVGNVKVRNLASGQEQLVPSGQLADLVSSWLAEQSSSGE